MSVRKSTQGYSVAFGILLAGVQIGLALSFYPALIYVAAIAVSARLLPLLYAGLLFQALIGIYTLSSKLFSLIRTKPLFSISVLEVNVLVVLTLITPFSRIIDLQRNTALQKIIVIVEQQLSENGGLIRNLPPGLQALYVRPTGAVDDSLGNSESFSFPEPLDIIKGKLTCAWEYKRSSSGTLALTFRWKLNGKPVASQLHRGAALGVTSFDFGVGHSGGSVIRGQSKHRNNYLTEGGYGGEKGWLARSPRSEFPGAFYHVMCRGDRRDTISVVLGVRRLYCRLFSLAGRWKSFRDFLCAAGPSR